MRKAKKISAFEFSESEFVDDLLQAVCMLVVDGLTLTYSHRSFQEYFVSRFIHLSKPDLQQRLIDRYKHRIDSDAVISLLHETDRELVERMLIVPMLDELAELIGFRRTVGITHYLRALKVMYTRFGTATSPVHGFVTEYADPRWFQLYEFLAPRYPEHFKQVGVDLPWTLMELNALSKRSGKNASRFEVVTKDLTTQNPLMRELAKTSGCFSMKLVKALMELRGHIRDGWKRTESSIDKILGM